MTDTEKAALERRIDELCAEVEAAKHDLSIFSGRIVELDAENAKLRELALYIMHQCNDGNPRCNECIDWNDGECVALLRMRELGIEAN